MHRQGRQTGPAPSSPRIRFPPPRGSPRYRFACLPDGPASGRPSTFSLDSKGRRGLGNPRHCPNSRYPELEPEEDPDLSPSLAVNPPVSDEKLYADSRGRNLHARMCAAARSTTQWEHSRRRHSLGPRTSGPSEFAALPGPTAIPPGSCADYIRHAGRGRIPDPDGPFQGVDWHDIRRIRSCPYRISERYPWRVWREHML